MDSNGHLPKAQLISVPYGSQVIALVKPPEGMGQPSLTISINTLADGFELTELILRSLRDELDRKHPRKTSTLAAPPPGLQVPRND
jgi:hypothetical protein